MKLQTHKFVYILLLLTLAAMTASAELPQAPQAQPGTIVGTVLDSSGAVVTGATVLLESSNGNVEQRLSTQDTGFFNIGGVRPGIPYHVRVSYRGLASWISNNFVLTPGQYFVLGGIHLRVAAAQLNIKVVPTEVLAAQQVKAAEKQRIAGVIPNFFVVYNGDDAAPLTPKLKFQLSMRFLIDPVTTAGFALNAALFQAVDYPSYGQGASAYGQRLGASLASGYTNILIGNAVLASILHQDPRYFYQGTGTTKSRLLHAISNSVVTKTDDGGRQFNYSAIGGDVASGAIANAYFPDQDRGVNLVFKGALIGAGWRMGSAVLQEFVLHKFTSRDKKSDH